VDFIEKNIPAPPTFLQNICLKISHLVLKIERCTFRILLIMIKSNKRSI
jgi:hypothetical protein